MSEEEQKLRVLVADDSAIQRKLVEHALEGEPYAAIFAKSGEEALGLYAEKRPSIVITDWMMEDTTGLELCEKIRRDGQGGYTYIIVLTSMAEKGNVVKGLAAGADDYLTKPFDPGELLARIGVGRRTVQLHREIEAKNQQLEAMAYTDPLTGLPNRRGIEEWAKRQLHSAARHGFAVWVAHMDLDDFKQINDEYGHEAGDAVLKRFGEVLKKNTRASDISGRIGGDEFLYVVSHVEEKHILTTVNRLREQFCAQKFRFGTKEVSVTASVGACGFAGKEAPEFWKLVREADQALYAAKRAGRNRVELVKS
ncbi:MAG TPA: diguanylate cyclase [Candidatus Acidoferrales bacterium]|nr:diguanylate cyclase [Candidatus Acidoferrales bacterium]